MDLSLYLLDVFTVFLRQLCSNLALAASYQQVVPLAGRLL